MTAPSIQTAFKIPESVLVVIYTPLLDVLMLQRTGTEVGVEHWQSVTGSKDRWDEPWRETAARELLEETGIDAYAPGCQLDDWQLENHYDIWPQWRHRYAPGVVRNRERVFGLCVPTGTPVCLNPREHVRWQWLPRLEAADLCFSASNAEACLWLPHFAARVTREAP